MKHIKTLIILLLIVVAWLWHRMPIVTGPLTRQTIFVAAADALSEHDADDRPHMLWIDDDGGPGMTDVKRVCDEMGIKAVFAVVPARLGEPLADSLRCWQQEGFGIALHGLRHESWLGWTEQQVSTDLGQCRAMLAHRGVDTTRLCPIVVPPHARNTRAIRAAVEQAGCRMVTGANVVNPSTHCQLWGRLWIGRDTDTGKVRQILERAREKNAFVVLGTHSSQRGEFSQEKVKAVIGMAREMGLTFNSGNIR